MEWVVKYWLEALFGLILAALGMAYRTLIKRTRAVRAEQDALNDGVRALLRDRIIQAYNFYCHIRGSCPMYVLDSLLEMYRAYHVLGGNGTIDRLMDEIQDLPAEAAEKV